MFRCHSCHEFYSAKCGSCTPELCGPGIASESFDFARDAACPGVYAKGSWLLTSVILVFALVCAGLVSLVTREEDAYSSDAEAYDAVWYDLHNLSWMHYSETDRTNERMYTVQLGATIRVHESESNNYCSD